MHIKKLTAGLLAVLMLLSISGCGKKEVMPAPLLDTYILELGEAKTVQINPPVEGAVGTLGEVPAGLEAVYTAPDLALKGVTPGDYTLDITFTAKGYEDSQTFFPVTVKELPPPQLEVALTSELLGVNSIVPSDKQIAFTMESGLSAEMIIYSKEQDIIVEAHSSDPALEVAVEGHKIALTPVQAGNVTLTITTTRPGFSDAVAECSVEVRPPYVRLALPADFNQPVKVAEGQTAHIPLEYDGTLSLSVTPDNATAVAENGGVTVKGVKAGSCVLTVNATMEGFQESSLEVALDVTAPTAAPAPKNVPADVSSSEFAELEKEILKYINIERAAVDAAPLTMDSTIRKAAALRAKELSQDQSHTRPDGRRGLTAFNDYGITKYNLLGENLSGSSDVEDGKDIVQRWMDSPSHREALLDPRFTVTGVGAYYDGEMYLYCQLFAGTVVE